MGLFFSNLMLLILPHVWHHCIVTIIFIVSIHNYYNVLNIAINLFTIVFFFVCSQSYHHDYSHCIGIVFDQSCDSITV